MTNPKDKFGVKKAPMSMIPAPVLMELGIAMLEGANKYGRHNYRAIKVRASIYYDAAMRHMMDWWEGQDLDPGSGVGLSHITKAIASLVVLRDAMMQLNLEDDRPIRSAPNWMDDLNKMAEALFEKHPNPVPPYREIDQSWADEAVRSDEVLRTLDAWLDDCNE